MFVDCGGADGGVAGVGADLAEAGGWDGLVSVSVGSSSCGWYVRMFNSWEGVARGHKESSSGIGYSAVYETCAVRGASIR